MRVTTFLIFLITTLKMSFALAALEKATFAGGCFWCMEPPFEKLKGVKSVISGFAGGKVDSPSYKLVSSGKTMYVEAVQVTYDPEVVSYKQLLETFWKNINPTDNGGQFVDRGFQYTTAIFAHNQKQKQAAEESKRTVESLKIFNRPIVTPIRDFTTFYPAEDYHQDFYKKNIWTKAKYKYYRAASGRDDFINKHWKGVQLGIADQVSTKPSKEELMSKLTKLQYHVTQENGTERPFENKYWNNKEEGIYVDIVSGEPLFSSTDKFKSGTGWPSFTKPLVKENIVEKEDNSLFSSRTEVRSRKGDSHLGHVFNDGPAPTGLRYCINSAALKFIKKEDLKKHGLGEYLKLFENK